MHHYPGGVLESPPARRVFVLPGAAVVGERAAAQSPRALPD